MQSSAWRPEMLRDVRNDIPQEAEVACLLLLRRHSEQNAFQHVPQKTIGAVMGVMSAVAAVAPDAMFRQQEDFECRRWYLIEVTEVTAAQLLRHCMGLLK